jgi:hypothetical protein
MTSEILSNGMIQLSSAICQKKKKRKKEKKKKAGEPLNIR